jgi:uncharacterized membrane protein (DUF485 family)
MSLTINLPEYLVTQINRAMNVTAMEDDGFMYMSTEVASVICDLFHLLLAYKPDFLAETVIQGDIGGGAYLRIGQLASIWFIVELNDTGHLEGVVHIHPIGAKDASLVELFPLNPICVPPLHQRL